MNQEPVRVAGTFLSEIWLVAWPWKWIEPDGVSTKKARPKATHRNHRSGEFFDQALEREAGREFNGAWWTVCIVIVPVAKPCSRAEAIIVTVIEQVDHVSTEPDPSFIIQQANVEIFDD